MSNTDHETWEQREVTGTLNTFDNAGEVRATVVIVDDGPVADCGCCPADPKPDSARYRTCGNAVTVPVVTWIGHRLAESLTSDVH